MFLAAPLIVLWSEEKQNQHLEFSCDSALDTSGVEAYVHFTNPAQSGT